MICGYKYRIYPNNSQQVLIHKTFGCVRKMWNSLLAQSLDNDNKHYLPKNKRTKKQYSVKGIKQEYGYMYEIDSHALASTWRNLKQAWSNHFRKNSPSGAPRFKKKRYAQSYQTCNLVHNCHGLEIISPSLVTIVSPFLMFKSIPTACLVFASCGLSG